MPTPQIVLACLNETHISEHDRTASVIWEQAANQLIAYGWTPEEVVLWLTSDKPRQVLDLQGVEILKDAGRRLAAFASKQHLDGKN